MGTMAIENTHPTLPLMMQVYRIRSKSIILPLGDDSADSFKACCGAVHYERKIII